MDDIENAINEGRSVGELGEEVWVPSAPHPSPEQATPVGAGMPPSPMDVTTPSDYPERKSFSDEKIQILRFTVTKTKQHTLPVNTENNASDSVPTAGTPKQVMRATEAVTSLESPYTLTTTPDTTTTAGNPTAPRRLEDRGKVTEVVGTQTEDPGQHTSGKTLTTLALLHGTVKELNTMTAAASAKEKGSTCGHFFKLQDNKYSAFCCTVLGVLCLFLAFTWLLSTLSTNIAAPAANVTLHANHSLARSSQRQFHEEAKVSYERTVTESTSIVAQYEDSEESLDPDITHHSSKSANVTDTDNEEQTTDGDVGRTEDLGRNEREQLKENKDEEPYQIPESNVEHEESEDFDSRRLEDQQPTKTVEIKPKILQAIHLKAQQSQEGGKVLLGKYVDFYRHLLHFFHIFGTFATVQGRMLENRLRSLDRYIRSVDSQHYTTLATMVQFEDTTGRIGSVSPFSGTTIFTCLHRHLQFMNRCLANILTLGPDAPLLHAFRAAYQDVLAIHHAWFVENFYLAGISMLPTKQAALRALSLAQSGEGDKASPKELHDGISIVVKGLENLTEASETVLKGCNALHKIPKQVIT